MHRAMTPQQELLSNLIGILIVGGGGFCMYLWPEELARYYQRRFFRADDVTPQGVKWVRRFGILESALAAIMLVDWFLESVLHLKFLS